MQSRFEQFAFEIAGVHRYVQRIERDEMEKYGYRGSYAQYLAALHRFPEGLTATQLCSVCEKDKAAISRVMADMVQKGLVYREGSNYRAKLRLTEEGRRAADYVLERAQVAVERIGQDLTEDKREVFYEVLEMLSANLEKVSKEGLPPG